MQILESFIKGKAKDQTLCEDSIVITNNFVAVIDGVTSKTNKLVNGKSGGKAAAEAIEHIIKTMDKNISVCDFAKLITKNISNLYEKNEEKGYIAATVIIYSKKKNEIWNIGDCQCIINGKKYLHEKKIDIELAEKRVLFIQEALKNGTTESELLLNDTGRKHILPYLKEQHKYANKDCEYGYPVVNGLPIPENMIITYKVNTDDIIILASDGYPFICNSLKESEMLLEKELKENPLCYKNYKSTKGIKKGNLSFDDRAYVKIKIG